MKATLSFFENQLYMEAFESQSLNILRRHFEKPT